MRIRHFVLAGALVAVVVLTANGNAVPAALLIIGYIIWLPFRDARDRASERQRWAGWRR